MPSNQPGLRYRVEPSSMFHGVWSLIDVFTGLPSEIGGFVSDCMSGEEADDFADTMNDGDRVPRELH